MSTRQDDHFTLIFFKARNLADVDEISTEKAMPWKYRMPPVQAGG